MASLVSKLNHEDGSMPFGLFCPSNSRLTWNCNYGFPEMIDGVEVTPIVSVFSGQENGEKQEVVQVLPSVAEAERFRDVLLAEGWKKLTPPKIVFKQDGSDKPLTDQEFQEALGQALKETEE